MVNEINLFELNEEFIKKEFAIEEISKERLKNNNKHIFVFFKY